jgi:hypothetical protein
VKESNPIQVQAHLLIQGCQLVSSSNNQGYAIYLTNTHKDGFFASQINRNLILGGIFLEQSGDSIWITHNIISDQLEPPSGRKTGITLNNDKGAVSSVIAYNSITAYGGAINILSGGETKILYNQLEARREEHKGVNKALLSIQGTQPAKDYCYQIDIIGNNINPVGDNDPKPDNEKIVECAIFIDHALETVIENNLIVQGRLNHIRMTENTRETRIGFNTWIYIDAATRVEPIIEGNTESTGTVHLYTSGGNFEVRSQSLHLRNTNIGFFQADPKPKPVVSGSTTDNTALTSLLAALHELGLITNNTTQ